MTEAEAAIETKRLFGEKSFTEFDDTGDIVHYYVGALPTTSGPYIGYMGLSWEEALKFAHDSYQCGYCISIFASRDERKVHLEKAHNVLKIRK